MEDGVLVTGSSGFVGSSLLRVLHAKGVKAYGMQRTESNNNNYTPVIADLTCLPEDLFTNKRVHTVVHTAAITQDSSSLYSADDFRKVNVEATIRLAKLALTAGVKRFIFISTVKVHGEFSYPNRPFNELSSFSPSDQYAKSKLDAERFLLELVGKEDFELIIIRPPLIYGLGAKGNIARLCDIAKKPYILPFGSIYNKRSMLSIGNLTSAIMAILISRKKASGAFLISDDQAVSISDIFKMLSTLKYSKLMVIKFPLLLLKLMILLTGRKSLVNRLINSLEIDNSQFKDAYKWSPDGDVLLELKKSCMEH